MIESDTLLSLSRPSFFSRGGPTAPTMMRRAVLAAAFSVLCSVRAFHVGPGMQGSRWVRPVPTSSASASRPGEESCLHSSMSMMCGFVCATRAWRAENSPFLRGALCVVSDFILADLYAPMYVLVFSSFQEILHTIMSFVRTKPTHRVMYTTVHLTTSL